RHGRTLAGTGRVRKRARAAGRIRRRGQPLRAPRKARVTDLTEHRRPVMQEPSPATPGEGSCVGPTAGAPCVQQHIGADESNTIAICVRLVRTRWSGAARPSAAGPACPAWPAGGRRASMLDAATSGYGGIRPDTGWECGACKGCSAARCSWRRSRRWPGRGASVWGPRFGTARRGGPKAAPGAWGGGRRAPAGGAPHAALARVLFLLGGWEGAGVGGYPTIESFQFGQEISFSHNGKPYLIYVSRTWLLDADGVPGRPLAMETGFWRPQPDGKI